MRVYTGPEYCKCTIWYDISSVIVTIAYCTWPIAIKCDFLYPLPSIAFLFVYYSIYLIYLFIFLYCISSIYSILCSMSYTVNKSINFFFFLVTQRVRKVNLCPCHALYIILMIVSLFVVVVVLFSLAHRGRINSFLSFFIFLYLFNSIYRLKACIIKKKKKIWK